MRTLRRNQRKFYYALYEGKVLLVDSYGYKTGETVNSYGKPVLCRANISPASGETVAQQFGGDESYDKVIVTELDLPIDEYSLLWVDTMPTLKQDGSTDTPHDYVVRKVAKSLNSTSYAISKVKVNVSD
jgi:hypothetical protein